MEYRKVMEVIPDACPYGGPGDCAGCEHCAGIRFHDIGGIEVECTKEEG